MLTYAVSWAVTAVFLGIACYVLDRWYGIRMRRGWHNLTHKEPLPEADESGFIHRRKAKARFTLAFTVALVLSLMAVFLTAANPAIQILVFFVMVPTLMIGFYLGPKCYGIWSRKDKILERVDDLEEGKIHLGEEIRRAAVEARDHLEDMILPDGEEEKEPASLPENESKPVSQEAEPEKKPEPKPEPEPDAEAMFRKFVDGGK